MSSSSQEHYASAIAKALEEQGKTFVGVKHLQIILIGTFLRLSQMLHPYLPLAYDSVFTPSPIHWFTHGNNRNAGQARKNVAVK